MLFLNHKGKKYSFILLLVILQNSYADVNVKMNVVDVKSQEIRQELQSADETNPIEEAKNLQGAEEDQVSSRINDQNTEDVDPIQTSRALDQSTQEEESNPLEDGFIVLPLKSKHLLTEGVIISPNDIRPTSRALNHQRPVGSRTEIVLPSLKELDEMKAAARQKRAKERAERQKRKKGKRNYEYDPSRYEYREVRQPSINHRFLEDSASRNRRVSPILSRRRVKTRRGVMQDRTFRVPKLSEQPYDIPELSKRKHLREQKLDDTEENDVSLVSEYRDLRNQEDNRDVDWPSVIVDPTSEEIYDGKYIPIW
ncbi:hypothetical protein TSAR_007428 [Trichomalopsis sarcophagae]|uniref:Uncharacterized protein n=1 Tax=Trichomalopsis sarcophagae TaxID=543379 RepID=A0A232FEE3_9HYME|nr:hypothetical protein TSAR_007428 [Trichomalopsis sarcophagae]